MLDRVSTKRITAEDVLKANGPWRDCEIWDGLPLVRDPSGGRAEVVAARVVAPLGVYVRERELGWVFLSSQGFLLARDPDRLLAADGAYLSRTRLPVVPHRGFVPMAPDFAIEVRSSNDTWEATVEKCGIWIAHGAGVVWAVDPDAQRVAVFRSNGESEVLERTGVAKARPALPEFSVNLQDLFEGL